MRNRIRQHTRLPAGTGLGFCRSLCVFAAAFSLVVGNAAEPLTSLEYRVSGTGLQVEPASVAAPKGIAGSVRVTLTGGDAVRSLAEGAYVEAFLRGPGLPEPRRIVAPVNEPLLFPPLNLVGDYQLDTIRLIDAATGEVRMEGTPAIVPVRVFDEVLVSRVTSRPLTTEEIEEKGIFIDEENFRAVEFEVGFVLDGNTIPVRFPVVSPVFRESTEIIPAAELEEKLAQAAALNSQIASVTDLPPDFETAQLNIQIQGINFQRVDSGEEPDLALRIPPIPALMVIPGNIGFLNQFFSVRIFTENAAPGGSGLSVHNIRATLQLPPGPDQVPAADYSNPGDDPLRFARIGPDRIIEPVQQIKYPGADGELGTADDVERLFPGESGQAEFLVEGLQEGLHVMDLDLTADLDGLAAGTVSVKGKAAGSVLVRNPRFSLAFAHPRTIRAGEPYDASVTLLNTGITPANLVSITLNKNSISGAQLEDLDQQSIDLGTLLPGESATATFRLRALRTGAISFSNLTTSDDSTVGRFRLSMGVDERGVALSPDTIAMPDFVDQLPPELLFAANRVLGQALSIATAGQLPPGVQRIGKSLITRRVLELAEAGQRLQYGDPLHRVLPDLLRDWEGARIANDGFDQILRETEAGREWREALFTAMKAADGLNATERLVDRAADLAGLGQAFALAAGDDGELIVLFGDGETGARPDAGDEPYAHVYRTGGGESWATTLIKTNATFVWSFTNAPASADLGVLLVSTNGDARRLSWTIPNPPADALYSFSLGDPAENLRVDLLGDGTIDSLGVPGIVEVEEAPPTVVAVQQALDVNAGRPPRWCIGPDYANYGTVVAVVFSKPVSQETAGDPDAYVIDGGNRANSVRVQPGGRVAYLNLRQAISGIIPRTLALGEVTDLRGNAVDNAPLPIVSETPGAPGVPFTEGVAVKGRVLRGDGAPVAGVPVTLTMYDRIQTADDCVDFVRRVSQVFTDASGGFTFDFVMAGIPYSISATDTSGLTGDEIELILQTTTEGRVQRDELERLANSTETRDTLLGMFAAGSLPQAIAKAEGLDRALIRDLVPLNSPRYGQTVPFVLQFRGRATVAGQVVDEAGAPLPEAAVNLFPDPDSRELGRGLYSDGEGRFAFFGVPLGLFTVDVKTSDRRFRTVAGLMEQAGQTTNLVVVVPNEQGALAIVRGRVVEPGSNLPHANARVFLGEYDPNPAGGQVKNVVRVVTADEGGNWEARDVPLRTYDVVAVSFDGRRKGVREDITTSAETATFVNLTLEDVTRVFGRVQFDDGQPAPNALVAGGGELARTDAQGNFTLEGVPVGRRTLSAGLERGSHPRAAFPRLGSQTADIVAGVDNHVVIKLRPAGRIFGRVSDFTGNPVSNSRVAIPVENGFLWTEIDGEGNYSFENLGLGNYTLSSPVGAVFENDTSGLINQIRTGNEDEILSAFQEAILIFTGANDPFLNGEGATFNPLFWGFTKTRIEFDGHNVRADITHLTPGTIAGRVLNHQGVPIGARVRLTGIGPRPNGDPAIIIRGERDSDPATGLFSFPGQALAGSWGVQVASPFYPAVLAQSGTTTAIDPNVTNLVFQFPPEQEVNGRIAGNVFLPDGTPAGEGVRVRISFSDDYEIQTDADGFFDTQIDLPALNPDGGRVSYTVVAEDVDNTGLLGRSAVTMSPGVTNRVDVRLLSKNSRIDVTVLRANGDPAVNAQVDLERGAFPFDQPQTLFTDAQGRAVFTDLWEGAYAVCAVFNENATRVVARSGVGVAMDGSAEVTLRLGSTGTIEGRFVKSDRVTPVPFAQVSVGNFGFATTDGDGRFAFEGAPLGTHRLSANDPVTGAGANTTATLSFAGEVRSVLLVETVRGTVEGVVIGSYRDGNVIGATVELTVSDGFTPKRTVTTGPDGGFSFPGTPVGTFTLTATHPFLKVAGASPVKGSVNGVLSENQTTAYVEVPLQALGILPVRVVRADGTTPAENVTVNLVHRNAPGARVNLTGDTDVAGEIRFADLPLTAGYTLTARSTTAGELRNGAVVSAAVTEVGENDPVEVVLPGVGGVGGVVLAGDASTPVPGAEVILTLQASAFANERLIAVSAADGAFAFNDIPVGPYQLSANSVSLAASTNGAILSTGQFDDVVLVLGASGTVSGRLVRADQTTVVPDVEVLLRYNSQSVNPGRAVALTDESGRFTAANIPLGPVNVSAAATDFGGLALRDVELTSNGEELDLGDLVLDEANPEVVTVDPPNSAIEIPIATPVELLFSEALATNSISADGIFLRPFGGDSRVEATVELLETNGVERLVRITPDAPLISEATYEVLVVAGDLLSATGAVIGSGPRDLVDRPLVIPFRSTFTTADNDPPVLLSLFPTNGAVQIDTRAVPRLSFNETLRPTGAAFSLVGPDGDVPGTTSVGVDGRVLSFVPDDLLKPNASYTLTASNVLDLAGNQSTEEPFTATFETLDTVGPEIAALRIGDDLPPIAGATVPIEAVLAESEPDARVRFTRDFEPVGVATNEPYRVEVTLPLSGSTTFRAIATDEFGNDGPFAELVIAVQANQPPSVQFTRVTPSSGPAPSGSFVAVDVEATDDSAVAELKAIVAGIGAGDLTTTNASRLRVQGFVSPSAGPGSRVQIFAEAVDDIGQSSGEQVFDLEISDGTRPVLTVESPPAQQVIEPGELVGVNLLVEDNFGVTQIDLNLSGAFAASAQTLLTTAVTNGSATVQFSVPSDAPTNHEPVTLSLTARDAAGNISTAVAHTLRMIDTTPPEVVSTTPANEATGVDPSAEILIEFSEPIDAGDVDPVLFSLHQAEAPENTPVTLSVSADGRTVTVIPDETLALDADYELFVASGVRDVSGNGLLEPFVLNFQTGDFRFLDPAPGQSVVEGQELTLVAASSTLVFSKVRFLVEATEYFLDDAAPYETNYTVPPLVELEDDTLTFTAEALDAADAVLAEAVTTVTVFAADVDTDGDGVNNGDELERGTDPFKPDALPEIQFAESVEIVQGVQTNFVVNVTDADGNLRSLRVRETGGVAGTGRLVAEFRNLTFTPNAMEQVDFNAAPVLVTEVESIAFPNTASAPWPGAPVQSVQVASRFVGRMVAPTTGDHQFRLSSDDGADLRVNGVSVVSRPNGSGTATGSVNLPAGNHDFELRHFNGAGGGRLTVEWSGPGFDFRVMTADDFSGFEVLRFGESGGTVLTSETDVAALNGTLEIRHSFTNEVEVILSASDADGLTTTRPVTVVTLGDLDGDGIPDRDDPDIDGDGSSNDDELLAGTDPRDPDTDGDGLNDDADPGPLRANRVPAVAAGGALRFDGLNDFVGVESSASLQLAGDQTIEFWIKPSNFNARRNPIAKAYAGEGAITIGTDGLATYSYGTLGDNDGIAELDFQSFVAAEPLVVDEWNHLALVRDLGAMRLRWYLNGELLNEADASFAEAVAGDLPLSLGTGPAGRFVGEMDEVRVWNVARTTEQIVATWSEQATGDEPGLVAAWSFDAIGGDRVRDYSPNLNYGRLGDGAASAMPLRVASTAPVGDAPVSIHTTAGNLVPITLVGADADDDPLEFWINVLPSGGSLYQTVDGVTKGAPVTEVPARVTDPARRVIYETALEFAGPDGFTYTLRDPWEDSFDGAIVLNVLPVNQPPVAADNTFAGFENTPLIIDPLVNDTDPDGDVLRVSLATPPANGRVTVNPDGTLTYTPDEGFSGTDSFTYAAVDRVAWNRAADFKAGPVPLSSEGNPSADAFGFPVWSMEWVESVEGLDAEQPWYKRSGTPMVWDPAWFNGGSAVWSRADDSHPYVQAERLRHVNASAAELPRVPVVRWISPLHDRPVDLIGELVVLWGAAGSATAGSPVDVDVILARHNSRTGVFTPLVAATVSKPVPADTANDTLSIPVDIRDVVLEEGDELVISLRSHEVIADRSNYLIDSGLNIVPSGASRYATVTINVGANSTPVVASSASPGGALQLDGGNDHLRVDSAPELHPTGAITLEGWVFAENLNANQIGIAGTWDDLAGANRTYMLWIQGGRLEFLVGNGGGLGRATAPTSFPTGRWVHVAGTYDGATIRLYVDGALAAQSAYSGGLVGNDRPFFIGRVDAGANGSDFFAGRIDEVRLWDVARTGRELFDQRNFFVPPDAPGLAGYWQFDGEVAGADTTANGLDGVLVNEALVTPSTAPVGPGVDVDEDTRLTLALDGFDADGDPLTTFMTRLPERGALYQTADGVTPGARVNAAAGNALAFDDDLAVLPAAVLDGRSDVTVEFWMKTSKTGIQSVVSGANGGDANEYLLVLQNDREFRLYLGNGGNDEVRWSIPSVADDRWHHIAVVRNQTAGEAELFLDGVSQGVREAALSALEIAEGGLVLGQDQDSVGGGFVPEDAFRGELDDVRVWAVARSATEIAATRHVPVDPDTSGLLANWRLDEADGMGLTDASANGFDGALGDDARRPVRVVSAAPVFAEYPVPLIHPDGLAVYEPDPDFFGVDSASYVVHDGKVSSTEGTVFLRVRPVNDPPVAVGDAVFALQGLPQITGDVLENDFDVDGDPIAVEDFTQPPNGTVTHEGGGVFIYTSDPAFFGEDTFTYRVTDGDLPGEPATVTVTVSPLDEFRWINPDGGNWNVAANWSQNRLPGSDDNVVIDLEGDYTVTLNVNATVNRLVVGGAGGNPVLGISGGTLTLVNDSFVRSDATLNFSGGTLTGGGRLAVDGAFNWTGGFMSGDGSVVLSVGAVGAVSGNGTKQMRDGRRLENFGTVTMTGGGMQFYAGSPTVLNRPGAEWVVEGEPDFTQFFSGTYTFVNEGTLRKTGAGTTTTFSPVRLVNDGTLLVEEGALQLNGGGSWTGEAVVSADAVLGFGGGTHNLSESAGVTGAGRLAVSGGVVTIAGDPGFGSALTLSGGALDVDGSLSASEFTQSGGALGGTGTLTIDGSFAWTAGSMGGDGTAVLSAGTVGTLSGDATKQIRDGRRLENFGTVTMTGGGMQFYAGTPTVINRPGAEWTVEGEPDFTQFFSGSYAFVNEGTLRKTGAGTTTTFSPVRLVNDGTLLVEEGALQLNGGGSWAGEAVVSQDAVLGFGGGAHALSGPASLTGAGRLAVSGGEVTISGEPGFESMLALSGGALNVNGAMSASEFTQSGGALGGTGTLTIDGSFAWTAGSMGGDGTAVLSAGTVGTLSGDATKQIRDGRRLENFGTLTMTGGGMQFYAGTPTVINRPGAEWTVEGEPDFTQFFSGTYTFLNEGTLRKTGAGTTTTFNPVRLINSGVVLVEAGELNMSAPLTHSGTITLFEDAVLRLSGGTHAFMLGGQTVGTGELVMQGSNLVVEDETVRIEAPLRMTGGTLAGAGRLVLAGGLDWSGGTMSEGGVTELPAGTVNLIGGNATKQIRDGRRLENFGTLTMSGGGLQFYAGTPTVINRPGAEWVVEGEPDFTQFFSGTYLFNNEGTFRKTGAGTTTTFSSVRMNSSGAIRVESGVLQFNFNATLGGAIRVDELATLSFTGGSQSFSDGLVFEGVGDLLIQRPLTLESAINLGDLKVTLEGGATVSGAFAINVGPDGELRVNRSMTIPGDLGVAGLLRIANAADTVTVTGTLTLAATGTIDNAGVLRAGAFVDQGGMIQGDPPVVIGLAPEALVSITAVRPVAAAPRLANDQNGREFVVAWNGATATGYAVEFSTNLTDWSRVIGESVAVGADRFETTVTVPVESNLFFRIRWVGSTDE